MTVLHPVLVALFTALDRESVRWTLLRVPSAPEAPTGDVDLLAAGADLDRLRSVVAAQGFVAVPGWERPPSLLFLRYCDDGRFLLLDVTDEVSFGPAGLFQTTDAAAVLAAARSDGPMRVPAPDDAFWALLLHCLLDKGRVPEHYRQRLVAGAATASPEGRLARHLGAGAAALRDAVAAADWPRVEAAAPEVAERWRARLGPRHRMRPAVAAVRRAVQAPTILPRRYGLSVALLGPNGSGKSTLTDGIAHVWPFPVHCVYMGLWKSGETAGSEIPGLAQLLRPVTAMSRYLTGLLGRLRGHLVVFDRYVDDARIPAQPPLVRLKAAYFWFLAHCIPAPNVRLMLDLPADLAYARKAENPLHEAEAERAHFDAIAAHLPRLHVLDATRSPDEVRRAAVELLWQRTLRRWGAA